MPPVARSISASRPASPDTAPCHVLDGLLESLKGIVTSCPCLDDSFPHDTTRQRNTNIAATGIVHYPWHPWRNRSVFIDDVIDRNGRVYFRCHVDETVHLRALEIPDWMLQESCSTTGLVETAVVNCSAL